VWFEYDEDYLKTGADPSPFRLKFASGAQRGADLLDGLPGLLDDSLPDGWARLVLDRFIRSSGYNSDSLGPLDRLALVGGTGPGAISYESPVTLPVAAPDLDFDTAADLVSKVTEEDDADRLKVALALTGSLGGARPKAHVWLRDGKLSTRSTPGSRQWIVKFLAKGDHLESGPVEYAYSLMARAAGIEIPATTLLPSKTGPGYFAVERFDRTEAGGRLHVHSLGGLLNASCRIPSLGYEELLRVTGALTRSSGFEQQVRRMAFNVFARNRDDHVKNHAFLMDSEGSWRPSPAFDVTYWDAREHQMIVGSEGAAPKLSDMLEVTRAVQIPDSEAIRVIDEVESAVRDWPAFAKQASVSSTRTGEIQDAIMSGLPSREGAHSLDLAWQRSKGRGR
jgi:serine/threonine-protein kinase HipA